MHRKYNIKLTTTYKEDIKYIKQNYTRNYYTRFNKLSDKQISYLEEMPRIYQKIKIKNSNCEHRRIVSGKHIIIYSIQANEVILKRVVSQKSNYLDSIKNIKFPIKIN